MAKSSVKKGTGKKKAAAKQPLFSKEQLLSSKKYAGRRDLLAALLEDGKTYATAEVELLLEAFLKGKVMD